jgi:hypothetical protein
MPKLITIYWRDIPAQVIARQGRNKFKQQLAPRFARAIDRAAMRAGRGSSKAYLNDWRRESASCDGDLRLAVLEQVAQLEAAFPDAVLESVTKRCGKRETHEDP